MKHPIIITSRGKVEKRRPPAVRTSLPYQGIARRALNEWYLQGAMPTYDMDIDISTPISK